MEHDKSKHQLSDKDPAVAQIFLNIIIILFNILEANMNLSWVLLK